MPPTVPINHYASPITNQTDKHPIPLFHANVFRRGACLKHSNFFKVKGLFPEANQWRPQQFADGWL